MTRFAKWGTYFAKTWSTAIIRDDQEKSEACDARPDFSQWIQCCETFKDRYADEEIDRTMQVMKRLRRRSIREYEVMYRFYIVGESISQATAWLNERARLNDIPLPEGRSQHYREKDTMALLVAGTEWALAHW